MAVHRTFASSTVVHSYIVSIPTVSLVVLDLLHTQSEMLSPSSKNVVLQVSLTPSERALLVSAAGVVEAAAGTMDRMVISTTVLTVWVTCDMVIGIVVLINRVSCGLAIAIVILSASETAV